MRGLAILATLLLLLSPSAAAAAAIVVHSDRPAFWQGEVRKTDPRLRDVPECRSNGCDRAFVSVRLPAGLRAKPGGVELAIRAVGATPDDSLGFAVYQGSRRVTLSRNSVVPPVGVPGRLRITHPAPSGWCST